MNIKRGGSQPGTSPVDINFASQGGTESTQIAPPNNQYTPSSGSQTQTPAPSGSPGPVLKDPKPSTKDIPGSPQYTGSITAQGSSSSPASPDGSGIVPSNGNPAAPAVTQQPGNSQPGQQISSPSQPSGITPSSSIPSNTDRPVLKDTKPSTKDIPGSPQSTGSITAQGSSSSPVSPDGSGIAPSNGNPAAPGVTQQPIKSQPGQQISSPSQPSGIISSSSIPSNTDGGSPYQPSNRPSDNIPAVQSPEPQSSTNPEPIPNSQPNFKQPSSPSFTMNIKRGGSQPGTSPVDVNFASQGGTESTQIAPPNNQYTPSSGSQTQTPAPSGSPVPVLKDPKPSTNDIPGSYQSTGSITAQGSSSSPASHDGSGIAPSNGNPATPGVTQQPINSQPGQKISSPSQPSGIITSSSIPSNTDRPVLKDTKPSTKDIPGSPQSTGSITAQGSSSSPESPDGSGIAPSNGNPAAPGVTQQPGNSQPVQQISSPSQPSGIIPSSSVPSNTDRPVLKDTKPSTKDIPDSSQSTGSITAQGSSSSPVSPDGSGIAPSNGNPAAPGVTQQPINSQPGQQITSPLQPSGIVPSSSIPSNTDLGSPYQPSNRPSDNIQTIQSPEPQSSTNPEPVPNSQPNLKQPSSPSITPDFKRGGSLPGTSPVDINFPSQGGTGGTQITSPNNQYTPSSGPQTQISLSPISTEPPLRDTKASMKDTLGSPQYSGPITTPRSSSSSSGRDSKNIPELQYAGSQNPYQSTLSSNAPVLGDDQLTTKGPGKDIGKAVPSNKSTKKVQGQQIPVSSGRSGTTGEIEKSSIPSKQGSQQNSVTSSTDGFSALQPKINLNPTAPASSKPLISDNQPSLKDLPNASQYTSPITMPGKSSLPASRRDSLSIPGLQSAGSQNPYQSTPSSNSPVLGDDPPTTKGPGKDIGQAIPSSKSSKKDLPNTFQYISPITTLESSSSPVSPNFSGVAPANANPTVPGHTQQSASKIASAPQMQSSTPNIIPENSQSGQQTLSSSQPGDSIQSSSISLPTDGRFRYQPSNASSENLSAPSSSSERDTFPEIINNLQQFINNGFNCKDFRNFASDLLRKLSTRNVIEESNCCKRKDFIEDSLLSALKNIPMYYDKE